MSPAALCPDCGVTSVPERGTTGPEVLRHHPACPQNPINLQRCRANMAVAGWPWRCDLLAGHQGNHRATGSDWDDRPSPPCVADYDDSSPTATIACLAEAVHVGHFDHAGPWWTCPNEACERATRHVDVRTLAARLARSPERHQGAQDGRGAIGVVWGVGVFALAIWGAQEAARLGGWTRLGIVVLTFVGVVASVALVEAVRRRDRRAHDVWDDPSFGGPWSVVQRHERPRRRWVDKRHATRADYEAWRRRPFRGG